MIKDYELIRSKRTTIYIKVTEDLKVLVRAPYDAEISEIENFIEERNSWIDNKRLSIEQQNKCRKNDPLSEERIEELKLQAKEFIPKRISYWIDIMNINPPKVKVTHTTTKWSSCTVRNNICITYLVMLLPQELIDYIIVRELIHIVIKNNNDNFYRELSKYIPDYKERSAKLKLFQWRLNHI